MATLDNNVFTLNKYTEAVKSGLVAQQGWNAAWAVAGYSGAASLSTVDRILFSTDTSVASVRGPISVAKYYSHGGTSSADGWHAGGYGALTTVDRIIYASDTAVATTRGNLSTDKTVGGVTQNLATDMWIGGGTAGPGPARVSTVERFIFTSDTATGVVKGPLPTTAALRAGIHDFSANGWYACREAPGGSMVERIIFASDTAAGAAKGPLSSSRYATTAGVATTTDGWVSGGRNPGSMTTVDRIIFATDTATAVAKGPLNVARNVNIGTANPTYGWVLAGSPGLSSVERITFSSDTATATATGPLSGAKYGVSAAI